jgi:hypothetical protein
MDPDYLTMASHGQAWYSEFSAPIGSASCGAMTQVGATTAYIRSHTRGVSIINIGTSETPVSVTLPAGAFTDLYGTPVSSPVSMAKFSGAVLLLSEGVLCGSTITDPVVTTTATVASLAATTLTAAGNVTDSGGGTVSYRGICYGTSPEPTATCTAGGDTGAGAFTRNLTGLSPCTVYYIRAKVTNDSSGIPTTYGSDITIKARGACASGDWTSASSTATIVAGTPVTTTSAHTAIMCGVTFQNGATRTITAFSRNGQDFTNRKTQLNTYYSAAIYSLLTPDAGTYDVSVTFSDAVNMTLSCTPWEGVGSFNTAGGDDGGQSDPTTIDAASGTGQVVFDVVTANNTQNPSPGGSQTALSSTTADSGAIYGETSYRASAGATTNMTWSIGAGIGYVASAAVAMIPGTVASSNWYTPATVKPYAVKASGVPLTHVADDAACPASIDAAQKWCHVDSTDRLYVRVTGDGNPGTVTIQCSKPAASSMLGIW